MPNVQAYLTVSIVPSRAAHSADPWENGTRGNSEQMFDISLQRCSLPTKIALSHPDSGEWKLD